MRHRVKGVKLGRSRDHHRSLLRNQSRSFFLSAGITTTSAKAAFTRPALEKQIALAKKGDLTARRRLFAVFGNRHFVNLLVQAVQSSIGDKTSNFTYFKKIKIRPGDQSLVVKLLPTFTLPPLNFLLKERAKDKAKTKIEAKTKVSKTKAKKS